LETFQSSGTQNENFPHALTIVPAQAKAVGISVGASVGGTTNNARPATLVTTHRITISRYLARAVES
jgi:hypothetical protein